MQFFFEKLCSREKGRGIIGTQYTFEMQEKKIGFLFFKIFSFGSLTHK